MSGWIGVDLDGTLARYTHWEGIESIGSVIEPMKQRVLSWLEKGYEVRIFTARVSSPDDAENAMCIAIIQDWLEANGLPRLAVTNVKDFGMIELWDDRAVQVAMNTGNPVGYSTRDL